MTYPGPNPAHLPPHLTQPPTEQSWVGPPPPQAYAPPQQYFPTAQHVTVNVPRPFNHALHVVLDLITCGFWIPVHILLWVLHKG